MEKRRGEGGVGIGQSEHVREVIEFARAAAGDDGHVDGAGNGAGEFEIVTVLRPIGVNAGQQNLTRATFDRAFGPFNSVEAGGGAATRSINFPVISYQ